MPAAAPMSSSHPHENAVVREIDVHELAGKLTRAEPVYLLDVRQQWERNLAALPGGALIPLDELPGRAAEVRPPDGALVVVYCHHGIRSLAGAAILERAGCPAVVSLRGGIDAWSRAIDAAVPRY
jgi:adenylyltransferase/sulfurtransferase